MTEGKNGETDDRKRGGRIRNDPRVTEEYRSWRQTFGAYENKQKSVDRSRKSEDFLTLYESERKREGYH